MAASIPVAKLIMSFLVTLVFYCITSYQYLESMAWRSVAIAPETEGVAPRFIPLETGMPLKSSPTSNALHYHWQPAYFTEIVTECILDDSCRILFNHVGKTGGSTIQKLFFEMMPPTINIPDSSFSAADLMDTTTGKLRVKFSEHPEAYCEQAKFSSYEVPGSGQYFKDIAQKCLDVARTKRFLLLTTYREPVARSALYMDHMCNKNIEKRPLPIVEACKRCKYNVDVVSDFKSAIDNDVWLSFLSTTNKQYSVLSDFNKHLKSDLKLHDTKHQSVDVLMMDSNDINGFLEQLDGTLVSSQQHFRTMEEMVRVPLHKIKEEKETLGLCNLGMNAEMINWLKTATEVYRELNLSR